MRITKYTFDVGTMESFGSPPPSVKHKLVAKEEEELASSKLFPSRFLLTCFVSNH